MKTESFALEIKSQLHRGDQLIIAAVVGCSPKLVGKVLRDEIGHRRGKSKQVVEIALRVIKIREELKEHFEGK